MQLGRHAAGRGFRAIYFDTLASTSDEAMARAQRGEASGLWIVAGEQAQGRGRQGRPWSSPRGNLHASVLLVDPCEPRRAAQLGFVAGVSLLHALRECAPAAPLFLKWPNDVLCGGAKLAGILVEGANRPGGAFACVIGFGVNCTAAPQGLPYRATSLADAGAPLAPHEVLAALADALAENLELWRRGEDFSMIRSAWLAGAHGLGRPLEARTHNGVARGVFETIDQDGRLVLATASGRLSIEAADVFPIDGSNAGAAESRT